MGEEPEGEPAEEGAAGDGVEEGVKVRAFGLSFLVGGTLVVLMGLKVGACAASSVCIKAEAKRRVGAISEGAQWYSSVAITARSTGSTDCFIRSLKKGRPARFGISHIPGQQVEREKKLRRIEG